MKSAPQSSHSGRLSKSVASRIGRASMMNGFDFHVVVMYPLFKTDGNVNGSVRVHLYDLYLN